MNVWTSHDGFVTTLTISERIRGFLNHEKKSLPCRGKECDASDANLCTHFIIRNHNYEQPGHHDNPGSGVKIKSTVIHA